jgi:hypothetical protein
MIADSMGVNVLPGWITGDVAALPSNTLRFVGMSAEALQLSGNTMISENKRLRSTYKNNYIGLNIATVKSDIGMVTGAIGRGAPMLADQFNTDPARFSYNMAIGALAGKAIGSGAGTMRPYMGMAVKRTGGKTILETAKSESIREIKLTGELKLDMSNSNDPISNVGYNPLQEPIYEGMSTESGYIIRLGKKSMPPSRLTESRLNVNTRSGFELLERSSKPSVKTVNVGKTIYTYKTGMTTEGILSTGITGVATSQNTKTTNKVDSILNFKMPTATKVKSSSISIPVVTTVQKTKQKQKPDTILNFKYSQSSKLPKNIFDNGEIPGGNRTRGESFFKLGGGAGAASKGGLFKMFDAHKWKNPGILSDMMGDFSFNSKRKSKKHKGARK